MRCIRKSQIIQRNAKIKIDKNKKNRQTKTSISVYACFYLRRFQLWLIETIDVFKAGNPRLNVQRFAQNGQNERKNKQKKQSKTKQNWDEIFNLGEKEFELVTCMFVSTTTVVWPNRTKKSDSVNTYRLLWSGHPCSCVGRTKHLSVSKPQLLNSQLFSSLRRPHLKA